MNQMEKNQIHGLLVKYFEGNTTLAEERILDEFFLQDNSKDAETAPLRKQFELFRSGRQLTFKMPQLDDAVISSIELYELRQQPPASKLSSIKRYMIAASISIAVILSGLLIFRSGNRELKDTYTDPRLAYAETQKALMFVSQKMNDGMKPLNNINKMNSGTGQLRNLEKMDKSLEMLNLVSFINQSSNLKK